MGNLNKVILIGYLGQDPEIRYTSNGTALVRISLATTSQYNDKDGNRQSETEWHRLIFWGKQADLISQYTKKGSQIYIEGRLKTREWEDNQKVRRSTTEIHVVATQFLDRKGSEGENNEYQKPKGNTSSTPSNVQQSPPTAPNNEDDFEEDNIPF